MVSAFQELFLPKMLRFSVRAQLKMTSNSSKKEEQFFPKLLYAGACTGGNQISFLTVYMSLNQVNVFKQCNLEFFSEQILRSSSRGPELGFKGVGNGVFF